MVSGSAVPLAYKTGGKAHSRLAQVRSRRCSEIEMLLLTCARWAGGARLELMFTKSLFTAVT